MPGEQIWRIHYTGVSSTSKNTFMRVPGITVSWSEMCSNHRTTNNLARMPQKGSDSEDTGVREGE